MLLNIGFISKIFNFVKWIRQIDILKCLVKTFFNDNNFK